MDTKLLSQLPLFYGIREEHLEAMTQCVGAAVKTYEKHERIYIQETGTETIGIVLSGKIHIVREDVWGRRNIVTAISTGQLMGEAAACGAVPDAPLSFYAAEKSQILTMDYHRVLYMCSNSCRFHHRLVENMVKMLAEKNNSLMEKIEVTSKKLLREKILTYLSMEAEKADSLYFETALGRTDMADYLCTDRSALTRELNAMRDEGIIDFDKNTFRIIQEKL